MALEAQNNPFTSVLMVEAADVEALPDADPSAGQQRLAVGTDHLLYLVNSSGTKTAVGGASGAVATDAIWDAAGDLAVGSGANTAAKLTKGAEGSALTVMDGVVGWNAATSMPGSPTTGQRVWRSDLALEFYYDGTRWLTTTLYRETFGVPEVAMPRTSAQGTGSIGKITPWSTTYDLWLDALWTSFYVLTTNNGTNYWTATLYKSDAAAADTSIASHTTAAHTASNWTQTRTAIGAVYTASGHRLLHVVATPTLSPGNLYWATALTYRLIGV